ncbi:MAG: hypothetical protein JO110_06160 [Acetobacteraceae bacterium]|nr:hypothetical protein [Acetobacteraceae bacterium]
MQSSPEQKAAVSARKLMREPVHRLNEWPAEVRALDGCGSRQPWERGRDEDGEPKQAATDEDAEHDYLEDDEPAAFGCS